MKTFTYKTSEGVYLFIHYDDFIIMNISQYGESATGYSLFYKGNYIAHIPLAMWDAREKDIL